MSTPKVSVIIPTHNRQAYLLIALDALARQTYPIERFEVVVVLDGCTDGSVEMLRNYRPPYRLRIIEQEPKGAAATRNRGAGMATGDLLVFLDDDVEPTPELIQTHVNAHSGSDRRVVIGYYPPALAGQKSLLALELQSWWEEMFRDMQEAGHRFSHQDMLSGNFSIPRVVFDQVRGFDPDLPMREDYELGMRLIQVDVDFKFEPEALGHHHEQAVLEKSMHRKFVEGIADIRVGQKHPELIPTLLIWRLSKYSALPSRVLQYLEFRTPRLANWIASKAAQALPGLESTHLVGLWRKVLYGVLAYWYWKGVIQELPTRKAVHSFLAGSRNDMNSASEPEFALDLSLGLDHAEQELDRMRPASVELFFNDHYIGRLPSQRGAEQWRGSHLRPYLVKHCLFELLEAFATQGIINLPIDIGQINAFTQNDLPV